MASASNTRASTSNPFGIGNSDPQFDVFINHRSPDVKNTFASHLYHRLRQHGFRVFLDRESLQKGDKLPPQIEGAIKTASVHIAILSPGYAQSSWCLKELVLMFESGNTILPVFYKVNPSNLLRWNGDGAYGRDLRMLEKKKTFDHEAGQERRQYDFATIEKWKQALFNVADMRGFDLQACNGDVMLLLDKVVQRVAEMFCIPHAAWHPHDQLEGDDSDRVSLLHPDDANGSRIELGLSQPVVSNNNNQQSVNELGVPQQLLSNNDSQQPDLQMGVRYRLESNINIQQDSGLFASGGNGANIPGSNPPNGNADGPRSNPDYSNDRRGYVQSISYLFATCHGAILAVVALIKSASVSSSLIKIRLIMLLVSALFSAAIIGDFVVKSYKEFRSQNRKLYWVIQRIALFLMLFMISVFLWLASNVLLKLHHPKL